MAMPGLVLNRALVTWLLIAPEIENVEAERSTTTVVVAPLTTDSCFLAV